MAFVDLIAILLISAVSIDAASSCSPSPIYVDIHLREVNGTSDFVYGSFIGVGTPIQNQSLWPSILYNETYFAADSFCNGVAAEWNCNASTAGGMIVVEKDTR